MFVFVFYLCLLYALFLYASKVIEFLNDHKYINLNDYATRFCRQTVDFTTEFYTQGYNLG